MGHFYIKEDGFLVGEGHCQDGLETQQGINSFAGKPPKGLQKRVIKDYKQIRRENYPSIETQLDDLWHSMDTGEIPKATAFFDKIKVVKETHSIGKESVEYI